MTSGAPDVPGDPARDPARRVDAALDAFGAAREPDVWATLAAWRAAGRRVAVLTVVESRGFTPQKAGTHMLLAADGATAGTIGGGAIEHEALREARELLASGGGARTIKKQLTQDLGMCCGGKMTVFLEQHARAPALLLFVAGHVAKELAALSVAGGFALTLVGGRPRGATTQRTPGASRLGG